MIIRLDLSDHLSRDEWAKLESKANASFVARVADTLEEDIIEAKLKDDRIGQAKLNSKSGTFTEFESIERSYEYDDFSPDHEDINESLSR
mmetsp:Transcript_6984/g.10652  ORF Transcript_6984/g.10652 Transcript_6984/m.10652 type:complete len:90 (+) Transcript_6984:216-485(+)